MGTRRREGAWRPRPHSGKKMDLKVWRVWREGMGKEDRQEKILEILSLSDAGREKDPRSGQNSEMALKELNTWFWEMQG